MLAATPADIANNDGHVRLWDVATGARIATLADPGGEGAGLVAFSPDGQTLTVNDLNGTNYLWDARTRTLTATLTTPGTNGFEIGGALSPDGKMLATDANGNIDIWSISS